MSQSYAERTVINAVDSILRIIGTEEGATTASDELKTMNPYISRLAVVDCLQVCNNIRN